MRADVSISRDSTTILRVILLSTALGFLCSVPVSSRDTGEAVEIPVSRSQLTIDGVLGERDWQRLKPLELVPSVPGVPEELGGNVRVLVRGGYLCLGVSCPEPGGKVLARSLGYNPVWEKDAHSSPEVEDRLVCDFSFKTQSGQNSQFRLEVNPWGALRLERDHRPVPSTGTLAAAGIGSEGWAVEAAIPLAELNPGRVSPELQVSVVRVRSRRALAPEFRWSLEGPGGFANFRLPRLTDMEAEAPSYRPPLTGNADPPLQVGRIQVVPALDSGWDDPAWAGIPVFELPRNEAFPRRPDFPTEVKWVHDGRTLAVFFRCTEDERVDCDAGERDGEVGSDDHVCICLSTTGSSLIEILVNPAGAVRDSKGSGPHMYGVSPGAWDENIGTHCEIRRDFWIARIDLPLDELAAGLGELSVPGSWRILVGRVRRARAGGTGELSTLPVVENPYLLAPARYRRLTLTALDPALTLQPESPFRKAPTSGPAGELQELDSHVLSRVQRKYYGLSGMQDDYFERRITSLAMEEHDEWDSVKTLEDWERFRDRRIEILKSSLGVFPEEVPPLLCKISGTYLGEGYQVKNLVYQSRPGLFVAANLYLPLEPADKMPGIIIIPSHHYPKTQGELKDCGMVWARAGCAVLIPDRLGCGERIETLPWYRQPYQSDYLFEMQLNLIGQTRLGWVAWDIIRSVDLLWEMDDIDRERIILIGSVTWGGGRPAALAGLFEKRIAALIPFNFGRVYWDSYEIRNSISGRITPWFICCAGAPRKFVYAHEFSWEGDEGPVYPSVWVPAWPRYRKIYSLYGTPDNLAAAQGKGILRVRQTEGDCFSLGAVQREPLYPILKQWFGIPLPAQADREIEIDSELSFARKRPDYAALKLKESMRRLPDSALLCVTPEISAGLDRKPLHQIAAGTGHGMLRAARDRRARLDAASRRRSLADTLAGVLGDIEPDRHPLVSARWSRKLAAATVEALTLQDRDGIVIPLLLIKPDTGPDSPAPLVIALAEGGKDRFLKDRSAELAELIGSGAAVCLPDVRGTGESAFGQYNRDAAMSVRAAELGETIPGYRLKDVRTVLEYLKSRVDIDKKRIALWGESFAPENAGEILLDELAGWPVSPQIQHFASPLGAHLVLLAALYHDEVAAVAAGGGLIGYSSILDHSFAYVPPDIVVPEILSVGDISDICAVLAPRPLLLARLVDGRNRPVEMQRLSSEMAAVRQAYLEAGLSENLTVGPETGGPAVVRWLTRQLIPKAAGP
ncbi:MAG: acetylxylan esterase [Candidatus Glassbacteria bacterium]|nr:acetylxylan esterase [Candidatus Glassbacteria bacterium]